MVTHEHDLVRHFGGRIINITEGEIVFDEVITGTGDELLADLDTEVPTEAMAAAISDAERVNEPAAEEEPQLTNTEDAIDLPIENMTADDIISAIGGIPDGSSADEPQLMQKLADNIDVDIDDTHNVRKAETPEELLAALTEKTEGGAE